MPRKMKRATAPRHSIGSGLSTRPFTYIPPRHHPVPAVIETAIGPIPYDLPPELENCNTVISQACILAMYGIPTPSNETAPSNSLGVFETFSAYSQDDLNDYFTKYLPNIPNGTHPILQSIDGGVATVPAAQAEMESNLDITLMYAIVYPQTITLYQVDDPYWEQQSQTGGAPGFLDTFLDAVDGSFCSYSAYGQTGNNDTIDPVYPDSHGYDKPLQCGTASLTNVLSVSYSADEFWLPMNYQQRQCHEFAKLAMQGHTIVFSTGDWGVAGPVNQCQGSVFTGSYPSTCPYITSVGASMLPFNGTVYSQEVAMSATVGNGKELSSSGGFSNIFAMPQWQRSAVEGYFNNSPPSYPYYEQTYMKDVGANGGIYNRAGRAYPDVSAVGAWWPMYLNGTLQEIAGTSMSAPIIASVINLIVEERIKNGKGPLGFINPAIYAHPEMFNDVTSGNNPGCGTEGFSAAQGWDPVTGMGTPIYPVMLNYFLDLP